MLPVILAMLSFGQVQCAEPVPSAKPSPGTEVGVISGTLAVDGVEFSFRQPAGYFLEVKIPKDPSGHYAWIAAPWPKESSGLDVRLFRFGCGSADEVVFVDDMVIGGGVLWNQRLEMRILSYERTGNNFADGYQRQCGTSAGIEVCALSVVTAINGGL